MCHDKKKMEKSSDVPFDNTFVDFGADTFTNFRFVAVNICTIEMTISDIDCVFYSLSDLTHW